MAFVKTSLLSVIVALMGVALLGSQAALAEPMKCSAEQTACVTNCKKAAKTAPSICLTNCGKRQSYCIKTGCWDNGVRQYCGLTKQ